MKQLKIAVSNGIENTFCSQREVVNFDCADLTEVSAIVLTAKDIAEGKLDAVKNSHFDIPVFAYATAQECVPVGDLRGVFDGNETNRELYGRQVDTAAQKYEDGLLPPFFGSLTEYVAAGNAQFDCPGHQGGAFYRRHPAGRAVAAWRTGGGRGCERVGRAVRIAGPAHVHAGAHGSANGDAAPADRHRHAGE